MKNVAHGWSIWRGACWAFPVLLKTRDVRYFPGVQWLGLRASTGLIPGRGTKIPLATWFYEILKQGWAVVSVSSIKYIHPLAAEWKINWNEAIYHLQDNVLRSVQDPHGSGRCLPAPLSRSLANTHSTNTKPLWFLEGAMIFWVSVSLHIQFPLLSWSSPPSLGPQVSFKVSSSKFPLDLQSHCCIMVCSLSPLPHPPPNALQAPKQDHTFSHLYSQPPAQCLEWINGWMEGWMNKYRRLTRDKAVVAFLCECDIWS